MLCLWCGNATISQTLDYHTNIKPIVQTHCLPCHTKAGIGAMPLTTCAEVKAYGKMVQYVTENRMMPPWKADANFSALKNANTLDDASIAAIKTWVDNGLPEGKAAAEAKPSRPTSAANIARPDAVMAMEKSFTIKDDYTERSQVFVLPVTVKKDEWVDAIEFVPGNRKLVKSCTVSVDTGQTGTEYDGNDLAYGYRSATGLGFVPYQHSWYQWTADEQATFHPPPYAKKLFAGSKLLLHITYKASKTIQKDSSFLKLRFAKKAGPVKWIRSEVLFDTSHITNGPFLINPGDKRKFYAERAVKAPMEIHSLMPVGQVALGGWEIYAVDSASQQRINLLKIPYWDAHWKKKYLLQNPVQLSAGSKIFGIAYYNNSEDNPNLTILPPKKIRHGHGQRDELFLVQFDVLYNDATDKQKSK